jgi:tryptophan-rich sensory protein
MPTADSLAAPEPWFSTGSFARAAIVAVPAILLMGGLVARIAGSTDTNPWYQSLTLPVFQPPGPLFGIAWAILYTLIGVAVAMVWGTKAVPGKRLAIARFAVGAWDSVVMCVPFDSLNVLLVWMYAPVPIVKIAAFAPNVKIAAFAPVVEIPAFAPCVEMVAPSPVVEIPAFAPCVLNVESAPLMTIALLKLTSLLAIANAVL